MPIRLYDTARRAIVPFEPPKLVRVYVCGITPYDSTHLGHAATYLTYDVLLRRLEELGHEVALVRNVTDVDDSILPKARQLGVNYLELADAEMARFRSDMEALGVRPPMAEPRATEAVPQIIDLVSRLLAAGHAYRADGSVFFDVNTFPAYGALSRLSREEMVRIAAERGGRPDDPAKRDPLDFTLWQRSAPDEPSWDAPFGPGRPGWHIECSAMVLAAHGPTLDLHGGGTDLIFPHHESEIAQSTSITGEPLARHWMHSAMVAYDGEKMSKSLGNLVFVSDLLKVADPRAIRLALLRHHYRAGFEWFDTDLDEGRALLRRLLAAGDCGADPAFRGGADPRPFAERVRTALDDDLDVPRALDALDDLASAILSGEPGGAGVSPGMTDPEAPAELVELARLIGVDLTVGAAGVSARAGILLAVMLAAGATVRPAGAQTATTTVTRDQAVRQVLAQRDDALQRGDRSAFLDTVDPSASEEFKARQGRLFDGLRSLPLASYELRLRTDEVPDLAGGGLAGRYGGADAVFLPPVEAHYRLTGIDTVDAVDGYYYTFLLRGGRWRIVSDRDVEDVGLPSARNLWDYGPVTQERTAHFTVFHDPADRKRAEVLAGLCEEAYARLTVAFGRPIPAQIVVVLPHNLDQLREILQATFDLSNFVAFASASVDRDDDWQSTAARVYVQDANLSRSRRDFQLQTFHHEFTHVAAFPLAGPFVVSWIHEGLADWMAGGRQGPTAVGGSDGRLPHDWEFTTGGGESILRAYDESTSAMAFLAAKKGKGAPLDLLVRVVEARAAPGTSDYRVDQALRAVYGAGLDQFQKDWNGGR